jgi:predicted ATPase/DNA-binding winged helix-turn-helix (wHTH) protein
VIYAFEDCVLDTERYVLRRGGEPRPLEPQVFDVLVHLIRNRGRLVTKEELLDAVWRTRFVSEASITSRIRAARKAVGDSGSRQTAIRTVRGRGYEFIAPVTEHALPPAEVTSTTAPPEPPTPVDGATVSSLPAAVQELIGRDALLAELREELARFRLVTLIGPGGVGKTTLAYELARVLEPGFSDGVHAVEFVTVGAAGTLDALATALDVQKRRDVSLEDAVINVLRPRGSLLLLDNCEHIVEPLGVIVDRILQAAPGVTVLATSRQPIAVRGERIWPVDPLPVGEEAAPGTPGASGNAPAVQLFAERASAANPRFALDDAATGPVVRICRRLDGMPLAIELAAARVSTLSVNEIEARLDERFRLLRGVRRGGDPRHQALQDAMQWSYDLLSAEEQRLFDELAIFAGQFDLAAAAAVCGDRDELDALDLVTSLAERSMIAVRAPLGGDARYEMLETLRDYGRSKLDGAAARTLATRHATYYAGLAVDVAARQRGAGEPAANARAEASFADLRTAQRFAVQRGDIDTALTLIGSLREYAMRSMRYEALGWADAALQLPGATEHALAPSVNGIRAYSAWLRGEFDVALTLANEVETVESLRGEEACGLAQRVQANVRYVQGDVVEGLAAGRRQLAFAEAAADLSRIAHATYMLSVALSSISQFEEASELALRARSIGEATGSPTDLASGWAAVGFASHDDAAAAVRAFDECDRIARRAGNRWMSAFARTELSALLLVEGDLGSALRGLAEAVDTWYRAGEWSQQWLTLARCVVALMAVDATELAAEVIGAVEKRASMGTPPVMAPLRERTLSAADELETRLGGERYAGLHGDGGEAPVADIVIRTRAELLRHVAR